MPAASDSQAEASARRAAELADLLAYATDCADQERRQLARHLHDNLGSSLTALSMHLSLLAQHIVPEQGPQERLALVRQLLRNIIDSNRSVQSQLWNDTFEFLGIKAALKELATRQAESGTVQVKLSLPEHEFDCAHAAGLTVLRTAQEGLLSLAPARQVAIVLDDNDEALTLTLCASCALPTDQQSPPLRLLHERARLMGGSIRLVSAADAARLTLHLPKQ